MLATDNCVWRLYSAIRLEAVAPEELGLGLERVRHGLLDVDVRLRAVHDADEAELERVHAPGEDVERVRACVHEVEFGEDADGASALGVDGAGELEGFGIGEVDVGGGYSENNTTRSQSVSHERT